MEILYAFLGGLVLTALVAFLIARGVVKSRVARTEETVRLQDESAFNIEKTRLETDLGHANDQVRELLDNLEKAKAETLKQVQAARDEAARANAEVIAARDKADSERAISPLVRVPEATLLDTTGMTIDEVVAKVMELCG